MVLDSMAQDESEIKALDESDSASPVVSAPGGASFARLCSACSMATMRGADSSQVSLFADSRYQSQPTFPGIRRAASRADFHDAWVGRRPMAIIRRLGLSHTLRQKLAGLTRALVLGLEQRSTAAWVAVCQKAS
jgi:hypothetical protein